MTENAELAKAERILRREDWDSLEQQVAAQREALLALHQALRDSGYAGLFASVRSWAVLGSNQ